MIGAVRSWFAALTLREKRLVLVAAALAVVTLLWFGIIRPIGDGLSSARSRYNGAVARLADTRAQMQALTLLQADRPPPLAVPIDIAVRDKANIAGFGLNSVTPQGSGAVQVTVTAARPAALFGWIADLESSGVIVETITTTDNGDQTVAATIIFKTRGI